MKTLITLSLALTFCTAAIAQQSFDNVEIKATHVAGTVHMLEGAGGNIGVSVGEDGILIVDNQFAPLAGKIEAALRKLNPGDIRFVLNTHWHGDHTGGNAHFGRLGTIIAHDQVLTRLAGRAGTERSALPVVTYQDRITVHFNGEEIHMRHHGRGHTDGDSLVEFKQANVLHMGDQFFNGRFPYIDLGSGGSVQGYIDTVAKALAQVPDNIKIIPGHGALATKEDLRQFHTMLTTVTGMVRKAIADGKSLDEVKAAGVPGQYKSWGAGFINESRFLEICYN
ncbi:MAG TPA: MBL fold metallo-hydrolase, partial [Verrucomicrobiales bacterium]|nr:MBL fold metallo-hydrolase [Verrucomicrobiales bacterium]